MTRTSRMTRAVRGGTALATLFLLSGPLAAQEGINPSLTFDFSSTLRASDNYGLDVESAGDSFFLDNRIGVGYLSETDVQSLSFGLSGILRFADLPDRSYDPDFDDTQLRFAYTRNGVNSRVEAEASYNRADVAFFDPLSNLNDPLDPIEEEDLIEDNTGTRETLGARLALETGLAGPLGFNLGVQLRDRKFVDTVDPDFYDSKTTTITAGTRFTLSPVLQATLSLSQNNYTDEDVEQTDRVSHTASLGLAYQISPITQLDTSIGIRKIDEEENIGLTNIRRTEKTDGIVGSIGLTRALPTGSVGVSLAHDVSQDGERSTLSVSRLLELKTGQLSFSLGATKGDNSNTGMIGDLNYTQELPNGSFRALLSRSISTDDDEEQVRTQATVGLSHDLTELSGLDLSLDYIDIANEGTDPDRQRGRIRAAYNYDLTSNWELSGGYTHTRSRREGQDAATENAVFLTMQRQFQTRP